MECFERTASKHVYYLGWNRSPAQAGCMRQVLGPGALERPRGMGWRGRWEGGSGWGTHVNPWLIHDNVWQKPLQYCKVISLQLIKINRKKRQNSQWFLGIINLKAVWYGMSFVYHLWLHIIFSRFIELLSNNWKLLFFISFWSNVETQPKQLRQCSKLFLALMLPFALKSEQL